MNGGKEFWKGGKEREGKEEGEEEQVVNPPDPLTSNPYCQLQGIGLGTDLLGPLKAASS